MNRVSFILFFLLIYSGITLGQPDTSKNEVWMQSYGIEYEDYWELLSYLNQGPLSWDGDYSGKFGVGYKFAVHKTANQDNISIIKIRYRQEGSWTRTLWISHVNKNYLNDVLKREGNYRVKFIEWTGVDEFVFKVNDMRVKAKIIGEHTLKVLEYQ